MILIYDLMIALTKKKRNSGIASSRSISKSRGKLGNARATIDTFSLDRIFQPTSITTHLLLALFRY